MISEILLAKDCDPTISVGGMLPAIGGNIRVGGRDYFVTEACEYTNSFLSFYPTMEVILNVEADHLDFFKDLDDIRASFKKFADLLPERGLLVINAGIDDIGQITKDVRCPVLTVSAKSGADVTARNINYDDRGCAVFDIAAGKEEIAGVHLSVPGAHNVENALAAAAVCLHLGMDAEVIREGLSTYTGTDRRFEYKGTIGKVTVIDDYAHHPQELATAISSLKEIFPTRKMTAIFQPHLFTRTRDFADGFAQALSGVDKLILLDIYPAREEPIPGVTSDIIFDKVTAPEKVLLKKEELMDYLAHEPVDVLVTFGAGNIDRFIGPITDMLEKRL
jgi:UDP-N-acetylmuramate--alanine ligase